MPANYAKVRAAVRTERVAQPQCSGAHTSCARTLSKRVLIMHIFLGKEAVRIILES